MLEELKIRLAKISDLENAAALLDWDQQTYMPPGGAEARAEQRATLATLSHELFTAAQTGALLEQSERERAGADTDSDESALLRITPRDYEPAVQLPAELVA